MLNIKNLTVVATLVLAIVPAMSQAQTINHRLAHQHARIHQGLKSGTMSRKQAAVDRSDDRYIHKQERLDRSKDNGHLTNGERKGLNRQLNLNSNRIYRQKHNGK